MELYLKRQILPLMAVVVLVSSENALGNHTWNVNSMCQKDILPLHDVPHDDEHVHHHHRAKAQLPKACLCI
jgi:hypothetical protein